MAAITSETVTAKDRDAELQRPSKALLHPPFMRKHHRPSSSRDRKRIL